MNASVIRNDANAFLVKINPAAFSANVYKGKPLATEKVSLAFNVNYNFGIPIGLVKESVNKTWVTLPNKSPLRPILAVDELDRSVYIGRNDLPENYFDIILQGGPLLINESKLVYPRSLLEEKFRADVARKTQHVVVALRKKKLIVGFFSNSSLTDICIYLQGLGCEYAMNCDGGHAAHLKYFDGVNTYSRGTSKATAGIQFTEL